MTRPSNAHEFLNVLLDVLDDDPKPPYTYFDLKEFAALYNKHYNHHNIDDADNLASSILEEVGFEVSNDNETDRQAFERAFKTHNVPPEIRTFLHNLNARINIESYDLV